jgi:hypothetical protein
MEMMKVDGKVMLVNDRTHFCCWWGPRIEQAGDVVARLLQVGMGMAQLRMHEHKGCGKQQASLYVWVVFARAWWAAARSSVALCHCPTNSPAVQWTKVDHSRAICVDDKRLPQRLRVPAQYDCTVQLGAASARALH